MAPCPALAIIYNQSTRDLGIGISIRMSTTFIYIYNLFAAFSSSSSTPTFYTPQKQNEHKYQVY